MIYLACPYSHPDASVREAGETYIRVNRISFVQPPLPFGEKR